MRLSEYNVIQMHFDFSNIYLIKIVSFTIILNDIFRALSVLGLNKRSVTWNVSGTIAVTTAP